MSSQFPFDDDEDFQAGLQFLKNPPPEDPDEDYLSGLEVLGFSKRPPKELTGPPKPRPFVGPPEPEPEPPIPHIPLRGFTGRGGAAPDRTGATGRLVGLGVSPEVAPGRADAALDPSAPETGPSRIGTFLKSAGATIGPAQIASKAATYIETPEGPKQIPLFELFARGLSRTEKFPFGPEEASRRAREEIEADRTFMEELANDIVKPLQLSPEEEDRFFTRLAGNLAGGMVIGKMVPGEAGIDASRRLTRALYQGVAEALEEAPETILELEGLAEVDPAAAAKEFLSNEAIAFAFGAGIGAAAGHGGRVSMDVEVERARIEPGRPDPGPVEPLARQEQGAPAVAPEEARIETPVPRETEVRVEPGEPEKPKGYRYDPDNRIPDLLDPAMVKFFEDEGVPIPRTVEEFDATMERLKRAYFMGPPRPDNLPRKGAVAPETVVEPAAPEPTRVNLGGQEVDVRPPDDPRIDLQIVTRPGGREIDHVKMSERVMALPENQRDLVFGHELGHLKAKDASPEELDFYSRLTEAGVHPRGQDSPMYEALFSLDPRSKPGEYHADQATGNEEVASDFLALKDTPEGRRWALETVRQVAPEMEAELRRHWEGLVEPSRVETETAPAPEPEPETAPAGPQAEEAQAGSDAVEDARRKWVSAKDRADRLQTALDGIERDYRPIKGKRGEERKEEFLQKKAQLKSELESAVQDAGELGVEYRRIAGIGEGKAPEAGQPEPSRPEGEPERAEAPPTEGEPEMSVGHIQFSPDRKFEYILMGNDVFKASTSSPMDVQGRRMDRRFEASEAAFANLQKATRQAAEEVEGRRARREATDVRGPRGKRHEAETELRGLRDVLDREKLERSQAESLIEKILKNEVNYDRNRPRRNSRKYNDWVRQGNELKSDAVRIVNGAMKIPESLDIVDRRRIQEAVAKVRIAQQEAEGPKKRRAQLEADIQELHDQERIAVLKSRGIQIGDVFLGKADKPVPGGKREIVDPFKPIHSYRVTHIDEQTGHVRGEYGFVNDAGEFVVENKGGDRHPATLGPRFRDVEQIRRGLEAAEAKRTRVKEERELQKQIKARQAKEAAERARQERLASIPTREVTHKAGKDARQDLRNQMKALAGEIDIAIARKLGPEVRFKVGNADIIIHDYKLPEFKKHVESYAKPHLFEPSEIKHNEKGDITSITPISARLKKTLGAVKLEEVEPGEVLPLPTFRKPYDKAAKDFWEVLLGAPELRGARTVSEMVQRVNSLDPERRATVGTPLNEAYVEMQHQYAGRALAEGKARPNLFEQSEADAFTAEKQEAVHAHIEEMLDRLHSEAGFIDLQDLVRGFGYVAEKGSAARSFFQHGRARPEVPNAMRTAESIVLRADRKARAEIGIASRNARKWAKTLKEEVREDIGAAVEGIENLRVEGDTPEAARARVMNDPKARAVFEDYRAKQEEARQAVNQWIREADPSEEEYIQFLDNYLLHMYKRKNVKDYETGRTKLLKNSPNARQRTLPTLKDAVDAGFQPVTQDVSFLHSKWNEVNWKVATTRRVLAELKNLKLDITHPVTRFRSFKNEAQANARAAKLKTKGARDISVLEIDGRHRVTYTLDEPMPAVLTENDYVPSGWKKIEHPAFKRVYAEKVGDNIVLYRGGVFIHPDLYPALRQLIDAGHFGKAARALEITNAFFKKAQLSFSLFHHIALAESAQAALLRGAKLNPIRGLIAFGEKAPSTGRKTRFFTTWREGMRLMDSDEFFRDATEHGLVLEAGEKFVGHVNEFVRRAEDRLRGVPFLGKAWTKLRQFNEGWDKRLWNHYHNGLKAFTYYDIVETMTKKNPDVSPKRVKEIAAEYINDAFGGQEWTSKFWLSPKGQRIARQVLLAPDWTLSNWNVFRRAVEAVTSTAVKGKTPETYLKARLGTVYWRNLALSLGAATVGAQAFIYQTFGDDEKGDQPDPFENEKDHEGDIDVTPLVRLMPGFDPEDKTRYYAKLGKQAREITKWFEDPFSEARTKASPMVREAFRQFTGTEGPNWDAPWRGKPFWLTVPERLVDLAKGGVPFAFRENNFGLSLPQSKGMTRYKGLKSYETAFLMYADRSLVSEFLTGPKDAVKNLSRPEYVTRLDSLVGNITDALNRNGIEPTEVMKEGLAAARARVYGEFWRELEKGPSKALDDAATKVVRLNGGIKNLKASMKARGIELDKEQVKVLKESYKGAVTKRREYLEALREMEQRGR